MFSKNNASKSDDPLSKGATALSTAGIELERQRLLNQEEAQHLRRLTKQNDRHPWIFYSVLFIVCVFYVALLCLVGQAIKHPEILAVPGGWHVVVTAIMVLAIVPTLLTFGLLKSVQPFKQANTSDEVKVSDAIPVKAVVESATKNIMQ